jgi:radical SAM protein with 4Fe4S-binding SPASM domain
LGFRVFVNTMLHAASSVGSLLRLRRVIASLGFERWRLDYPFSQGSWAANCRESGLETQRQIHLLARTTQAWAANGCHCELEAGRILKYLGGRFYFLDRYSPSDPVCPCRILPVLPNGDITWCTGLCAPEHVIGSLFHGGIARAYAQFAWHRELTIESVCRANGVCSDCQNLSFCGCGCRVEAMTNGGSFYGPDMALCEMHRNELYLSVADGLRDGLRAHRDTSVC